MDNPADKLRLLSARLVEWKTRLDAEPVTAKPPVSVPPKSRKPKPLFEDFGNDVPVVTPVDPFAGLLAAPSPKPKAVKPVVPEDVVKLLPEGFSAVSDAGGIVHDGETIAIMCPKKHMHKYKMRSVITAKTVKCITCAAGPAFPRVCREIAEEIFGAPFVFNTSSTTTSEYRCPIYKITLICEHFASFDSFTQDEGTRVIKMGKCPEAKIRPTFWRLLSADSAKTTLTQGQQKRVEGLAPVTKSKRVTHVKDPLPTTKTSNDMTNFCIENCGL